MRGCIDVVERFADLAQIVWLSASDCNLIVCCYPRRVTCQAKSEEARGHQHKKHTCVIAGGHGHTSAYRDAHNPMRHTNTVHSNTQRHKRS